MLDIVPVTLWVNETDTSAEVVLAHGFLIRLGRCAVWETAGHSFDHQKVEILWSRQKVMPLSGM